MTLNRIPAFAYNVLQMNLPAADGANLKVRQAELGASSTGRKSSTPRWSARARSPAPGPWKPMRRILDPVRHKQDVEKAKAVPLMKEGARKPASRRRDRRHRRATYAANEAQVLQSQPAAIGVKLNIKTMDLKAQRRYLG